MYLSSSAMLSKNILITWLDFQNGVEFMELHRTIERFRLEGTLNTIQFQPPGVDREISQ